MTEQYLKITYEYCNIKSTNKYGGVTKAFMKNLILSGGVQGKFCQENNPPSAQLLIIGYY
jgi:hypothetical protein